MRAGSRLVERWRLYALLIAELRKQLDSRWSEQCEDIPLPATAVLLF